MGWLDGQVALITGAGSGLGRALVDRFLDEGGCVGALERDEGKAEELASAYPSDRFVVQHGDATSWADNQRAVRLTIDTFGALDTFVANAGIWDYGTALTEIPGDTLASVFDDVVDVNVKAATLGARAAAESLATSRGSLIVTLSNAAFHPGGGGVIYTLSKHALRGLIVQLAYEWAPDVRVNGVAPGGMSTDLRGPRSLGLDGKAFSTLPVDDIMRSASPLHIAPRPADYTGSYVLLAARAQSSTATGIVIECDAGVGIRGRPER